MGVDPHWSHFVAFESQGHKFMNEAGVSHYTFELLAHVYKSGMVIGVMCEPIIGRKLNPLALPYFALNPCRTGLCNRPRCCFRSSS